MGQQQSVTCKGSAYSSAKLHYPRLNAFIGQSKFLAGSMSGRMCVSRCWGAMSRTWNEVRTCGGVGVLRPASEQARPENRHAAEVKSHYVFWSTGVILSVCPKGPRGSFFRYAPKVSHSGAGPTHPCAPLCPIDSNGLPGLG